MAQPLRLEYEDAFYHVTTSRNGRCGVSLGHGCFFVQNIVAHFNCCFDEFPE